MSRRTRKHYRDDKRREDDLLYAHILSGRVSSPEQPEPIAMMLEKVREAEALIDGKTPVEERARSVLSLLALAAHWLSEARKALHPDHPAQAGLLLAEQAARGTLGPGALATQDDTYTARIAARIHLLKWKAEFP